MAGSIACAERYCQSETPGGGVNIEYSRGDKLQYAANNGTDETPAQLEIGDAHQGRGEYSRPRAYWPGADDCRTQRPGVKQGDIAMPTTQREIPSLTAEKLIRLRAREGAGLRVEDCLLGDGQASLVVRQGKGDKQREVFPQRLKDHLTVFPA